MTNEEEGRFTQQWADFWKVWWHCFTKGVLRLDDKHRMCELSMARRWIGSSVSYHFCNCGYLWEHVPEGVPLKP